MFRLRRMWSPSLAWSLYRFGAELFYANAGRFIEEVSVVVQPMPSAVKWVVVDAEAMTHLDYTAARILKR